MGLGAGGTKFLDGVLVNGSTSASSCDRRFPRFFEPSLPASAPSSLILERLRSSSAPAGPLLRLRSLPPLPSPPPGTCKEWLSEPAFARSSSSFSCASRSFRASSSFSLAALAAASSASALAAASASSCCILAASSAAAAAAAAASACASAACFSAATCFPCWSAAFLSASSARCSATTARFVDSSACFCACSATPLTSSKSFFC
mmetsp:Transcript_72920/g.173701  ORF Transcript_72920/g.173701 Transcript_72920/m.173701 type:complete len:205 (+) Transcript_72920:2731-3345(+)